MYFYMIFFLFFFVFLILPSRIVGSGSYWFTPALSLFINGQRFVEKTCQAADVAENIPAYKNMRERNVL